MQRATVADSLALTDLYAQCFKTPWQVQDFVALLQDPSTIGFVTTDAFLIGRIVGDEAEIITLGVINTAWRKGTAEKLLACFLTACGDVTRCVLEVNENNPAALGLYHKLGFTVTARRPNYYQVADGREDALILVKTAPF